MPQVLLVVVQPVVNHLGEVAGDLGPGTRHIVTLEASQSGLDRSEPVVPCTFRSNGRKSITNSRLTLNKNLATLLKMVQSA